MIDDLIYISLGDLRLYAYVRQKTKIDVKTHFFSKIVVFLSFCFSRKIVHENLGRYTFFVSREMKNCATPSNIKI